MFWLFWCMGLMVFGLTGVATWLWWKVWRQAQFHEQQVQQQSELNAKSEQARLDYIYESLNVIARAVLDGQCPMTEGCIRMAVLLDNLSLDCDTRHRFSSLFEIYNATKHIPTHSSWKALGRKAQRQHQREMNTLEKQNEQTILDIMTYVKNNPFGSVITVALN